MPAKKFVFRKLTDMVKYVAENREKLNLISPDLSARFSITIRTEQNGLKNALEQKPNRGKSILPCLLIGNPPPRLKLSIQEVDEPNWVSDKFHVVVEAESPGLQKWPVGSIEPFVIPITDWKASYIERTIKCTNGLRTGKGLGDLVKNEKLCNDAMKHAERMAEKDLQEHANDIPQGNAENIASGDPTPEIVVNGGDYKEGQLPISSTGWKGSTPHYNAIMTERYKLIGVGIAISKKDKVYWVQRFTDY